VIVRENLKRKRPDVEIVGGDLHPLFQVKDFAPYVAKIRASGADAVVTGNWSADLTLLIKAAKDAGLKVPFYTYRAATKGVPTALAAANADNVSVITYWNPGDDPVALKTLLEPFKAKYDEDFAILPFCTMVKMLSQAVKDAKSTEPLAVAKALEGMRIQSFNGEVQMRKSDHQIQQSLVLASWGKVDGKSVRYDMEKTGHGFRTIGKVDAYTAALPTTCQMKRPQ
jgi:branched-chain amino acid transport system substrate-binding protein